MGLFHIDEVRELVQGGGEVAVTERREEGDNGAAPRPFGVAVVDPVFVMTERKEESCEGDLIECLGSCLALLVDSQAAISDEVLFWWRQTTTLFLCFLFWVLRPLV